MKAYDNNFYVVIIVLLNISTFIRMLGGLIPEQRGSKQQPGGDMSNVAQAILAGNAFDKEKLDRLYKFPANYKEAMVHRRASKFGYSHHQLKSQDKVPVCPCCENLTSTMDIPLCYSTDPNKPEFGKNVFLLATDVSLYFVFIKMVILFLLMKFIVVDAYTFYASLQGGYCKVNHCAYSYSGYNLSAAADQKTLDLIDILALAFTLFSIIFFIIFRKKLFKMADWLDFSQVSQDDFTILIEDVPKFIFEDDDTKDNVQYEYKMQLEYIFEEKVHDWIENVVKYTNQKQCKNKIEKDFWKYILPKFEDPDGDPEENDLLYDDNIVTGITLCYDLTDIENINTLRQKLVDEFLLKNTKQIELKKTNLISYIPNRIDVINRQFIHLCEEYALSDTPPFNLSKFTGKAFISFQYQHYRDLFVEEYEKDPTSFKIAGNPIRISLTNQPTDIFWYNMKISEAQRSQNIFYSWCILGMLLILSFAALVGLQFWQTAQSAKKVGTSFGAKILSYAISGSMAIITNIINFILSYSIELLADMERHKTKSQRSGSLILKIVISQTINTSIIYSVLYLLKPINPLGTYGLVNKINSLVVVSGLISVVWQIFVPVDTIMTLINKYRYTADKPINLFQYQLNTALEQTQFSYAQSYSFYIIYTFVVAWYGFLVPTATPILIGIFFVQYWVDKYNLFRRYSTPVPFGPEMIRFILKSFEASVFIFAIGFFVWQGAVHNDTPTLYRVINIATLVIATLFSAFAIFLPARVKAKIFGEDPKTFERLSYSYYRSQGTFPKTYFRESPATFCLKETKIKKKEDYGKDDYQAEDLPEAEDPQFVKDHHFDKYINLTNEETYIDTYDNQLVGFFNHMGDQNYNYLDDDPDFLDQEKKKLEQKKMIKKSAQKPK